jgi:hypothetical protein
VNHPLSGGLTMTKKALIFCFTLIMATTAFKVTIAADQATEKQSRAILHEELAGLLFDHLELGKKDAVITQEEKILALKAFNYQPTQGYKKGSPMHFGELAVILVRVYPIEDKLPKNYTESDAIKLCVDQKIFSRQEEPETEVEYPVGVELINNIPRSPGYPPKTVLLPRIPTEPPVSHVD